MITRFELKREFNAQFDYVREAYSATALNPMLEGYYSYCDTCMQNGITPVDYAEFRKQDERK